MITHLISTELLLPYLLSGGEHSRNKGKEKKPQEERDSYSLAVLRITTINLEVQLTENKQDRDAIKPESELASHPKLE
jgi:hypothetical protein